MGWHSMLRWVVVNRRVKVKGSFPVLLLLPLLFGSAQAMPGGGRFAARDGQGEGFSRAQPNYQREAPGRFQRHDPGSGVANEPQRQQRLSPEERRQLRRDVHQAGRELYSPRP
jgi:hypothetical protein